MSAHTERIRTMIEENQSETNATPSNMELAKLSLDISRKTFERFKDRRQYEWKLTFTIWGALGAFSFLYLKDGSVEITKGICLHSLKLLLFAGPTVIHGMIHFWWLQPAYRKDQEEAFAFEEMSIDLANGEIASLLKAKEAKDRYSLDYEACPWLAGMFQLSITIALSCLAVIAVMNSH